MFIVSGPRWRVMLLWLYPSCSTLEAIKSLIVVIQARRQSCEELLDHVYQ